MYSRINSVDSINYTLTPVLKESGKHCLYLDVLQKKNMPTTIFLLKNNVVTSLLGTSMCVKNIIPIEFLN